MKESQQFGIPKDPAGQEKQLQGRVYEGEVDESVEFAAKANELATAFLQKELGK
jgi:hypothetical protein